MKRTIQIYLAAAIVAVTAYLKRWRDKFRVAVVMSTIVLLFATLAVTIGVLEAVVALLLAVCVSLTITVIIETWNMRGDDE